MTCSQMSGPCDVSMAAATEKEMMDKGWAHVEEAHPDVAEKVKAMSQEEKDKWSTDFHTKWEETPEDSAEEADAAPEAEEEEEAA